MRLTGRETLYLAIDSNIGVGMSRSEEQWRSAILGATSNGNRLSGRVFKGDKYWVAQLPALEVMTQGKSRDDAHAMVKDMLETLVNLPGFSVRVHPDDEDGFEVTSQGPSQLEPAWTRHDSSPESVAR